MQSLAGVFEYLGQKTFVYIVQYALRNAYCNFFGVVMDCRGRSGNR